MSQRIALGAVGLISLVLLAFGAGYVSYPLLHPTTDSAPPGEQNAGAPGDPMDMSVYWQVWQLLARDFYGESPGAQDQVYGAVRGLVEAFDDPYTYFVEPQPRELERDQLRGSFGGIGAYIETTDDGFVLQPMPDQPAAAAGVEAGDLLVWVDDTEITAEMTADEVVALVRGPADTDVTIVVRRGGEGGTLAEELSFTITRAVIETPSVAWEVQADADGNPVGLIALSIFNERSAEEMRGAVDELTTEGVGRFVLDLRGNPGGLVSAAVEIADMWLDGGDILIEERADGSRSTFAADRGQIADDAPLVVIVDGASASASEIVAGALQDHGRALLVGEQTFGKGSVQLIHELSDESSLHVTNAEWFTPNGSALTGVGLTPDRELAEGEDPVASAIELLRSSEIAKK
jgi:carboxyl-terminal processing protease